MRLLHTFNKIITHLMNNSANYDTVKRRIIAGTTLLQKGYALFSQSIAWGIHYYEKATTCFYKR